MPTTITTDPRKVIPALPPLNWRKEIPIYRVRLETVPSPKERHKFEPPFASCSEAGIWQYGERIHHAGEIIATTEWPNAGTMTPLNYPAQQVLQYFTSHQKSRLARSPWRDDQVSLDDGLSGAMPKITAPQPEPVRLQPRQVWPGM